MSWLQVDLTSSTAQTKFDEGGSDKLDVLDIFSLVSSFKCLSMGEDITVSVRSYSFYSPSLSLMVTSANAGLMVTLLLSVTRVRLALNSSSTSTIWSSLMATSMVMLGWDGLNVRSSSNIT